MVYIFMDGRNVFIKYIDFYEWLFFENFLTFQFCNTCKIKKENSAEVSLKEAFISCKCLTHYGLSISCIWFKISLFEIFLFVFFSFVIGLIKNFILTFFIKKILLSIILGKTSSGKSDKLFDRWRKFSPMKFLPNEKFSQRSYSEEVYLLN